MNFKDKVVMVTGASRGIGKDISINFAKAGATVILISRTESSLSEVQSQISKSGGISHVFPMVVSSLSDFEVTAKKVYNQFGRIDILVNNAGITRDNLIMRMKENDWDDVLNINLKGVFSGIKAVTRFMMKTRAGRIINISSVIGQIGNPGQSNYAASKAGVFGLTKAAAKELGSRNITVNAIAPGYIMTEMTDGLAENIKIELLKLIPLGKFGTTLDVSNLAMFLASDEAAYITGQVLNVDGGMVM